MRNGGSPPAHLSSSFLSDPSGWLQYKWLQPPPRAPDWVIANYLKFNPLADVGCPLCDKEWLQRALCEDQQVAGLLPPNCPGGPFYMGLVPTRNMPNGIGSGQLTTCGRTSTIASRQQPANAISTRKPLINARRPIVANDSLTSVPPTNARRPSVVNGFLTRRLHVVSAFSTRRLLVVLWPNALLLHSRWRQPKLSSCGFAAAASMSGLTARVHGDSNARPLSHVCNTSRTAACAWRLWRSSNDRQLQLGRQG